MRKKNHKTDISASSVHKYDKSCSWADLTFYGLLELYEQNCHKTRFSASSVQKHKKSGS